ncbi:hypothetical protein EJB05_39078 [Eragrostis curvula]|uniref:DNA topoisomerase 2 n=1 Tax=Eragrostis curvula TaxID=38414 RepID=A0A5J9TVW2_9POAL|nr:hypothetical protein EJB05_39078 [Eragrostis curvula]
MDPQPQPSPALNSAGKALRDHILLHPYGYIGSMEKRTQKLWIREGIYLEDRDVTYVPGLLRIFDEILIYATENKQRDPTMNALRVDVDVANCRISVYYHGKGIPIEVNTKKGVYMPEIIFGHLSNCDNNVKEEDITGRRNGYGVKLTNIFSTEFVVETADGRKQKKYKQVFSEHMEKKSEPEITGYRKGVNWSWTMVTFKPDLAKFNMTHLEEDDVALMRKRVFDMAGFLGATTQVVFNGKEIYVPGGFSNYVYQYIKPGSKYGFPDHPWVYEKVNDQWEVVASVSGGQFEQVSFVNKVATISGGTHVDYVSNLIVAHAVSFMKDKLMMANIEEHDVKRHLMVFINVLMENPTFSSPNKEALITPQEDFGPELKFSDRFLGRASVSLLRKLSECIFA